MEPADGSVFTLAAFSFYVRVALRFGSSSIRPLLLATGIEPGSLSLSVACVWPVLALDGLISRHLKLAETAHVISLIRHPHPLILK